MAAPKVLLAYNFTPDDEKALDFAARTFSRHEDIDVTLFHVYQPVPDIKAEDSSVMSRMKSSLNYLTQKVSEKEAALKEAAAELVQRGFASEQVHYLFKPRKKDIATEIIDQAEVSNFQVVILNHRSGRVARFFAASTVSKVISGLTGVTVCVVT